jgi:hypothetical protein
MLMILHLARKPRCFGAPDSRPCQLSLPPVSKNGLGKIEREHVTLQGKAAQTELQEQK